MLKGYFMAHNRHDVMDTNFTTCSMHIMNLLSTLYRQSQEQNSLCTKIHEEVKSGVSALKILCREDSFDSSTIV
jgi:flagellar biosynthesis chaperone FliJ